jgi:hypothetical protein
VPCGVRVIAVSSRSLESPNNRQNSGSTCNSCSYASLRDSTGRAVDVNSQVRCAGCDCGIVQRECETVPASPSSIRPRVVDVGLRKNLASDSRSPISKGIAGWLGHTGQDPVNDAGRRRPSVNGCRPFEQMRAGNPARCRRYFVARPWADGRQPRTPGLHTDVRASWREGRDASVAFGTMTSAPVRAARHSLILKRRDVRVVEGARLEIDSGGAQ